MMPMKDKLNIKVKLADLAPLGMVVSFEGEEEVRLAERYVNRVWSKWMELKPPTRHQRMYSAWWRYTLQSFT